MFVESTIGFGEQTDGQANALLLVGGEVIEASSRNANEPFLFGTLTRASAETEAKAHPVGTIELDIDEKAGIDPTVDNDETTDRKFRAWNRREQLRELRWQRFIYGAVVGGAIVYWWLR